MKTLKVIGGILVLAVLLFVFVANFSAVEARFECNGKITLNGAEHSTQAFLKLQKYRWWIGLWSDSSGSAWVELPNRTVSYFGHLTETGDLLQLWDSPNKFSGNFSSLSGAIRVDLGAFGVFEGTCKAIQQ